MDCAGNKSVSRFGMDCTLTKFRFTDLWCSTQNQQARWFDLALEDRWAERVCCRWLVCSTRSDQCHYWEELDSSSQGDGRHALQRSIGSSRRHCDWTDLKRNLSTDLQTLNCFCLLYISVKYVMKKWQSTMNLLFICALLRYWDWLICSAD